MREQRLAYYALSLIHGVDITITRAVRSIDINTGKVTESTTTFNVVRALFLPPREMRRFMYDAAFNAANKTFTYGGAYGVNDRLIIAPFPFEINDIVNGAYRVKSIYTDHVSFAHGEKLG